MLGNRFKYFLYFAGLLLFAAGHIIYGQELKGSGADSSFNGRKMVEGNELNDSTKKNGQISVDRLLESKLMKVFLRDTAEIPAYENVLRTGIAVYNGRPVRQIIITRVDIFAPSVMDTGYISSTWAERAAKAVHTDTRRKVIQRNLLVSEGDHVDDRLIMENEVLLRRLPYVMDARFVIRVIPGSDSVDIQLFVKDLWSLGGSAAMGGIGSGDASLWNQNIFGLGHNLRTTAFWNNTRTPLVGYSLRYGIPNIRGSFISLTADHINTYSEKAVALNISRNFRTTGLKYGGAADFARTNITRDFTLIDSSIVNAEAAYNIADIWFGRMFRIKTPRVIRPIYLTLSGRAADISFNSGPETGEYFLSEFQDKTSMLFSLSFSRQSFRRDNYIYAFDRTEDVPSGFIFQVTSGYEWGQFKERPYLSGRFASGSYIPAFGYIHGSASWSTYYYRGIPEQSLYNLRLRYFTEYYNPGFLGFRGFATLSWQKLMNQYDGQYITLENRSGISGLRSPELRGDEKYLLNLESDFFISRKVAGFRSVVFLSADLGVIVRNGPEVTDRRFFSGLGIGLRIRNDQLVFDTFEIKFNFYPGTPDGAVPVDFNAGSVPRLRLEDFYPGRPESYGCGTFLNNN